VGHLRKVSTRSSVIVIFIGLKGDRFRLSLPKMLSGVNTFEISNIQEARDGGPTNLASRM
jgi:hypothetical protein